MSAPQTINEYLAAFNEALEVGLRSRRRIFWEVTEHLRQAAGEQVRRGANAQEAQQRAIALFGSPEEVAARFETGVFGRLDRRLALSARWLYRFTTERSAGAILAVTGLELFLAAAVAAVAAFFGHDPLLAASMFVAQGAVLLLIYGWPSRRHRLREMLSRSDAYPLTWFLAYPAGTGFVLLLNDGDAITIWEWSVGPLLTPLGFLVVGGVIEHVIGRVARRCSGTTDAERRLDWGAERPWRAALAAVAPLPLTLLVLFAAYPGPGDLRLALAGLLAAVGGLAVVIVRLEHSRREKDDYRTFYGTNRMSTTTSGVITRCRFWRGPRRC